MDPCRVSGASTVPASKRAGVCAADATASPRPPAGTHSEPPMAAPRRIGILTGGGDVPGLNSVIKSVVYRATELGYEVVGIRRGWEGLTHQRRGPGARPRVRPRSSTGSTPGPSTGPAARSSTPRAPTRARCGPRRCRPGSTRRSVADKQTADGVYDLTDHVLDTIEHLGLTNLVTIGGDDTLSFSSVLLDQRACRWSRSPRRWTTTSTGPSTASASRPPSRGRRRSSTASARRSGRHERIGVFRIFGRDAGFTALYTAYVTSSALRHPGVPVRPRARWRRSSRRTIATTPAATPS